MTGNFPPQLTDSIQLRYEKHGVFDKFTSAAEHAAEQTKKRFNQAFGETERVVQSAVGRMSSQFGRRDLGLGDLQKQAADIRLYRAALAEVSHTATSLAKQTGDTSVRTKEYLQALSAQRAEADRALAVADAQVATYTRLQQALDGAALSNSALPRAQREAPTDGSKALADIRASVTNLLERVRPDLLSVFQSEIEKETV